MMETNPHELRDLIRLALREDVGDGDHSALSCVPENATKRARLLVKQAGILAGVEVALVVFDEVDPALQVQVLMQDGSRIEVGDIVLTVEGSARSILQAERLMLNLMQRMSGIATYTRSMVDLIADLYDMIMLKDNHIDYAGGIEAAITRARGYLAETGRNLKIEVETRNLAEVDEVLRVGGIDIIMLDNFSLEDMREAVQRIGDRFETEASGNIKETTLRAVAETGVDSVSSGALTHQIKSLDLSLKAGRPPQ